MQHCRMRRANCIRAHGHALPVPPNHLTEELTRLEWHRLSGDGQAYTHLGPRSSGRYSQTSYRYSTCSRCTSVQDGGIEHYTSCLYLPQRVQPRRMDECSLVVILYNERSEPTQFHRVGR